MPIEWAALDEITDEAEAALSPAKRRILAALRKLRAEIQGHREFLAHEGGEDR